MPKTLVLHSICSTCSVKTWKCTYWLLSTRATDYINGANLTSRKWKKTLTQSTTTLQQSAALKTRIWFCSVEAWAVGLPATWLAASTATVCCWWAPIRVSKMQPKVSSAGLARWSACSFMSGSETSTASSKQSAHASSYTGWSILWSRMSIR